MRIELRLAPIGRVVRLWVVLVCGAAMCLVGGCAVLTVDVDVYKGPLANHLDVQVQQAATTALAAKPLLGRLRYELEKLGRYPNEFFGDIDNDIALRRLYNQSDYIPAYDEGDEAIAKGFNGQRPDKPLREQQFPSYAQDDRRAWVQGEFAFQSPQAAFVNRILAEYNDADENWILQEGIKEATLGDEPAKVKALRSDPVYKQKLRAARGRPGPGIESLINAYFEQKRKQNVPPANEPPGKLPIPYYTHEEGDLFDALIHFSEKVLFNANNSVLFGEQPGLPPLGKAGIVRLFHGGSDPNLVSNSYLTVLQAVGNSILVNLNELREHMQYVQDASVAVVRERRALEAALMPDPYQVLSDFLHALQAELAQNLKQQPTMDASTDPIAETQAQLTAAQKDVAAAQTALNMSTAAEAQAQQDLKTAQGKAADLDSLIRLLNDPKAFSRAKPDPIKAATFKSGQDLQAQLLAAAKDKSYASDADHQAAARSLQDPDVTAVFKAVPAADTNAKALADVQGKLPALQTTFNQTVDDHKSDLAKAQQDKGVKQDALNKAQGKAPIDQIATLSGRLELLEGLAALAGSAPKTLLSDLQGVGNLSPAVVLDRLSSQLQLDKAAAQAAAAKAGNAGASGAGADKTPTAANQSADPSKPEPAPVSGSVAVSAGGASASAQAAVSTPASVPAATPPASQPAKPTGPTPAYFDAALKLVSQGETVAPRPRLVVTTTQPDSPQNVIDSLIAELNEEYIQVVKENGKDSPVAKNYEAAIDVAYGRRADMIYLRPASAYLRSSFPVSSLQRDARIGWTNMLEEQGFRQIPGVTELLTDYQKVRTLQELDKQNWQNINTIRVAGAGNTNYVVAKDDIGNWYVKDYSADPKDIIQSAQSLAMFGLGPGLKGGTDLLSTMASQRSAATLTKNGLPSAASGALGTAAGSAASPPTTVVGIEMQDAQTTYDQATANTLQSLSSTAAVSQAVTAAWAADKNLSSSDQTALNSALASAVASLQKTIQTINPSAAPGAPTTAPAGSTPGEQIVDILRAEKQFYSDLSGAIDQIPITTASTTPPAAASPAPAGTTTTSTTTVNLTPSPATPAAPAAAGAPAAAVPAPAAPPPAAPATPPASVTTVTTVTPAAPASPAAGAAAPAAPAPATPAPATPAPATPAPAPATPAPATPQPASISAASAAEAKQKAAGAIRDKILTTIKSRQQAVNNYLSSLDLITKAVAG